jgi:hypothetical protein
MKYRQLVLIYYLSQIDVTYLLLDNRINVFPISDFLDWNELLCQQYIIRQVFKLVQARC